jgi:hypothetical protein
MNKIDKIIKVKTENYITAISLILLARTVVVLKQGKATWYVPLINIMPTIEQ